MGKPKPATTARRSTPALHRSPSFKQKPPRVTTTRTSKTSAVNVAKNKRECKTPPKTTRKTTTGKPPTAHKTVAGKQNSAKRNTSKQNTSKPGSPKSKPRTAAGKGAPKSRQKSSGLRRRMSLTAERFNGAMRNAIDQVEPDGDPHSSTSLVRALPAAPAEERNPIRHTQSARPSRRSPTPDRNDEKRKSRQPRMYKDPTLRARVPRYVLEGGTAPPFRRRFLSRVFRSLRPNHAVKVEPLESGLSTSVLYAPELVHDNDKQSMPFVPTTLVSNRPEPRDKNIVYQDSPFEIRVSGMLVRNFDRWGPSNDNELLMYSIQTDPGTTGDTNQSLPFIHYDFQRDGSKSTEQPNIYIPIPASKSYVMSSPGKKGNPQKVTKRPPPPAGSNAGMRKVSSKSMSTGLKARPKKSVNVQFRILEMDNPSETIKQAVSGIDELGGFVSSVSAAAPFLGVLSPALGLASTVSKRALDSYAQPDKVISIDMDFLLADKKRVVDRSAPPGEYLRYGYYFFLSEPIEGKLYASVRTPKNVQLMLRRCDADNNMPTSMRGDPVVSRRFFPLLEVSYLVVRVVEPTGAGRLMRRPIQMTHANQLESIFNRTKLNDDPQQIRDAIWDLGRELGVIDSDSEEDVAKPQRAR